MRSRIAAISLMMFLSVAGVVADTVVWDGEAGDYSWITAANWNPDTVPNSADDFDFTGSTLYVRDGNMTANSLIGGAGSQVRIRTTGLRLTGDLVMTGTVENATTFRMYESGDVSRVFLVDGSATLGGTKLRMQVDESGDTLILAFTGDVTLLKSSAIYKYGGGTLNLNLLGSLDAAKSTLVVDGGDVILRGNADYSGLGIDVLSGALNISYDISVASLRINGTEIAPGTYAPGNALYTTYAGQLLDNGGTLTVREPPTLRLLIIQTN